MKGTNMPKRKPASNSGFARTAMKTKKQNLGTSIPRGGYRL